MVLMTKNIAKQSYLNSDIPRVILDRLPIYLRILSQLQQEEIKITSSNKISQYVPIESSQIRKDLTYLGINGINGKGYSVKTLKQSLQKLLGLDASWNAVLIGGSTLGRSAMEFMKQKKSQTYRIVAAFDPNTRMIGKKISNLKIQNIKDLQRTIKTRNIKIGIIATPNNITQLVADTLIANDLYYLVNFSSFTPKIPDYVIVKNLDPGLEIESMTYYLRQRRLNRIAG
ncbi:MAG: redox-sensing transcriptional repressor Rex [Rickettsiales bacterium]|nr:redox-sensing transcriptional repressor Rex [Rickettsiales bacterium]|tara:strand:- start:120 stop:806 length:687 start_codon:yes stop_codon:yes gene_type:complete